jgi:hypothetical protein
MFETMAQFMLADHIGDRPFKPALDEMGYESCLSGARPLLDQQRPYFSGRLNRPAIVKFYTVHRPSRSDGARRATSLAGKP